MTRYYTDEHEWLDLEGDVATIGITDYAQQQLGDIVFVELPEVGARLSKGDAAAVVESVKAASDVYSPVTGEVLKQNEDLESDPALLNEAPEERGWIFTMTIADLSELENFMDEEAYKAFCLNN